MKHITNTITRYIATAAIKSSWAVLSTAERHRALGERIEAWAHRLATRWDCVDDALATLTNEALRR